MVANAWLTYLKEKCKAFVVEQSTSGYYNSVSNAKTDLQRMYKINLHFKSSIWNLALIQIQLQKNIPYLLKIDIWRKK